MLQITAQKHTCNFHLTVKTINNNQPPPNVSISSISNGSPDPQDSVLAKESWVLWSSSPRQTSFSGNNLVWPSTERTISSWARVGWELAMREESFLQTGPLPAFSEDWEKGAPSTCCCWRRQFYCCPGQGSVVCSYERPRWGLRGIGFGPFFLKKKIIWGKIEPLRVIPRSGWKASPR